MKIRLLVCSHCSTGGRKSKGETCKQMIALEWGLPRPAPAAALILLGGKIQSGVEIRAALAGAEDGLLAPPTGDVLVIAGAENGGPSGRATPRGGSTGVLQQAVPVALLLEALRVGEHPGTSRATASATTMAASSPPVSTKSPMEISSSTLLNEPLVDALIVPAHQNQVVVIVPQAAGVGLHEGFAGGDM